MRLRTKKILQVWSNIPNPTDDFFYQNGIHPQKAMRDITYTPEIESAIIAREAAVVGDCWHIIGNSEISKIITSNMQKIYPTHIFRSIMESIWYGFTVLEHPVSKKNGFWEYEKISSLPSEWFKFNDKQELIISDCANNCFDTDSPFRYQNMDNIHKEGELVQYRRSYTNPYGESQLARVFWSATWLRGDMELWANYIDKFGDDSILARTEISSPQKREELLQAIVDFRSSGGMVVEGTDDFSLLKSEKVASAELFRSFHEVCVQQINKLILGHASALDSTAGKLGNDQGLSLVRKDITKDDKMLISETMNRLIYHLCVINNWPVVKFIWSPEKEDELSRIERDQKIASLGFKFSEEYIRKTYQFDVSDIKKQ